jgi:hypothetical protein
VELDPRPEPNVPSQNELAARDRFDEDVGADLESARPTARAEQSTVADAEDVAACSEARDSDSPLELHTSDHSDPDALDRVEQLGGRCVPVAPSG